MVERTVLILEQRRRWTPELQRQFADEETQARAFTSAADLESIYGRVDACVVILDLPSSADEAIRFLSKVSQTAPQRPVIAVGSHSAAGTEWALRELGIVAFVSEFIQGEELADLCRRQWSLDENANAPTRTKAH